MNLLIIFLSIIFIFLIAFGGTILGKIVEDYIALKREEVRGVYR